MGLPFAEEHAMSRDHTPRDGPRAGQPALDGLTALLDTERELDSVLERADEEAARVIADARTQVALRLQEARDALAEELQRLDEREAAATEAAVDEAARAAVAHAALLAQVPDERVRVLADALIADFLGLSPLEGAP